jgi:hypothetical protein
MPTEEKRAERGLDLRLLPERLLPAQQNPKTIRPFKQRYNSTFQPSRKLRKREQIFIA